MDLYRYEEHLRNIKRKRRKNPLLRNIYRILNRNIKSARFFFTNVNNYEELNIREAMDMSRNNSLDWDVSQLQHLLLN